MILTFPYPSDSRARLWRVAVGRLRLHALPPCPGRANSVAELAEPLRSPTCGLPVAATTGSKDEALWICLTRDVVRIYRVSRQAVTFGEFAPTQFYRDLAISSVTDKITKKASHRLLPGQFVWSKPTMECTRNKYERGRNPDTFQ